MSWDIDGAGKEYLYEKKIEELKEQNKTMREALEWYAKARRYGDGYYLSDNAFNDIGQRARKALEETK